MPGFLKYTYLSFIFICFCLSGCFPKKHTTAEELISISDLRKDFIILRKTLEEVHPGLYWYSDKTDMDSFLDSSNGAIHHPMTNIQFFKFLLPVIAGINCSHTKVQPPSSADSYPIKLKRLLPFEFYCHSGKVYITKARQKTGHEGEEIVSINGLDVQEILRVLLASLPADGYNETYKYGLLNKGAFREGFALFFGEPENFTIASLDKNQRLNTFLVAAITPAQIPVAAEVLPPPIVLDFHNRIAILTINTFKFNPSVFHEKISRVFQTLHDSVTTQLIIDLRKNGGGTNDNVSTLYSYIAKSPFLHLKKAETTTTYPTYSHFISNAEDIEKFVKRAPNTRQYHSVNNQYAGTKRQEPVGKNLFSGKLILLTSGVTSSAASEFAAIVRFHKRAAIVGEETGGCYYGGNGGVFLNLKLPHSKLTIVIPTVRILTAVDEAFNSQPKGRGTFPHFSVLPDAGQIISGRDTQLEKALSLLKD